MSSAVATGCVGNKASTVVPLDSVPGYQRAKFSHDYFKPPPPRVIFYIGAKLPPAVTLACLDIHGQIFFCPRVISGQYKTAFSRWWCADELFHPPTNILPPTHLGSLWRHCCIAGSRDNSHRTFHHWFRPHVPRPTSRFHVSFRRAGCNAGQNNRIAHFISSETTRASRLGLAPYFPSPELGIHLS